jgi:protein phosphatase
MGPITWYTGSTRGTRKKNEDSFLARKSGDYSLFIIADGLGGHPAGDVASRTAITACDARADQPIDDPKKFLLGCLELAESAVRKQGEEVPECSGMGTTLLAAVIGPDGKGLIMNVGDSRGHLIDGKILHTRDKNMAQDLVQSGKLTEEEAMSHPLSKILNQALGEFEPPVPDFYSIDMKGKYLLLSSDGLHGFVPKEKIREIVIAEQNLLSEKVQSLIDEALRCRSDDNITVVLAREK